MSLSERRAMWQDRIQAFKESGEKSVAAWCRKHQINVNSMYSWLKKDAGNRLNRKIPHPSAGLQYTLQSKTLTFRHQLLRSS